MDNSDNWYTRSRALINFSCLIAQISLFILVHDISISYFLEYKLFSGKDISWGISVEYIVYEFVILFLTQCFFIYQFPKKMTVISILASLVMGLIVMPYYGIHPFRVMHIGLEGIMCVWIPFVSRYFLRLYRS
jgi:hypothetical protein